MHSHTRHVEAKHLFICDHITKGDIELKLVITSNLIADVFTKPLVGEQCSSLVRELGMLRGRDLDADHALN